MDNTDKSAVQQDNGKRAAGDGPYINLSVKLFLTDIGESEAKEGGDASRVRTMEDFSGKQSSAVMGNRLFASTLKQFIINSKINQIELQRVELVSRKHEITDLTKLIVYSLLYRLFPNNLCRLMKHIGITVPRLSKAERDRLLAERGEQIRTAKQDIMKLTEKVPAALEPDADSIRRKEIRSVSRKLVEMIPAEFYKALFVHQDKREEVYQCTETILSSFLERTKISDYLSSAFLEWVENAERANLEQAFAVYQEEYQKKMGNPFPVETLDALLLEDRKYRQILTELAEKNHISLKIAWKFGRSRLGHEQQLDDVAVVRIRLFNKGLIGDWVRSNIEKQLNLNTRGKHLGDFYDENQAQERLGSGLGLVFTSFLREECLRQHVDLFVRTRENQQKEETVMTLTMKFNPYLGQ